MKEDSAVPGLVAPTLRVHVWRIKTWQSPQDVVLNQIHKMLQRCVATHRLFSALAKDAIGTGPGHPRQVCS